MIVHAALKRPIRDNQFAGLYWNNAQDACRIAKKLGCPNIPAHTARALSVQVLGILNQIQSKSVYLVVQGHFAAYTTS